MSASVHAGMPDPPLDQADPPGPGRPPRTRQTPPDQAEPPRIRQTPPDQADPPRQTPTPPESRLQHTVYERPVRILLECILVEI